MVKDVQDRVFQASCLSQFAQDAWRERLVTERAAVSAPARDGGIQLTLGMTDAVRPGEPDGSQQQRLIRIREGPDGRLAAGHRGGQPQVEQRSAAPDMHPAATRIRARQHPRRVGVQLHDAHAGPDPKPPRLGVMHRRGSHRCPHQVLDQLRGQLHLPRSWPAAGHICLHHAASLDRSRETAVGPGRQPSDRPCTTEPGTGMTAYHDPRRARPHVHAARRGRRAAARAADQWKDWRDELEPRAARPRRQRWPSLARARRVKASANSPWTTSTCPAGHHPPASGSATATSPATPCWPGSDTGAPPGRTPPTSTS